MQEPKIVWNENTEKPKNMYQANEPEDIDTDNLPKRYPQFATKPDKQQKQEHPGDTRYVEFDEKAFLNQTNFVEDNEPFDVIPLPSKGYFYPNKKSELRVGYLTAADENILTSPNLLQSGKLIDVLLRRKIKDKDIEVSKLLSGDRTAIMLFLRATGYGKDYPILVIDPATGEEFEYVVDLETLPIKEMMEIPDDKGEFPFDLPRTKKKIKMRLLTQEDDREIDKVESKRKETYGENYISNRLTMRLEKSIMEIDGNRDKSFIADFIQRMPAFDSLNVRSFLNKIEPGVDTRLEIKAPSGETVRVNVPFGPDFFWPKL